MLKYKQIKDTYGPEVLKSVKKLEQLSRSIGRYKSHVHFNLHCKHNNVIPKSLKITSPINSNNGRNIIHQTERRLLNVRISETLQKKAQLISERNKIIEKIRFLPNEIYNELINLNESREKNELTKSAERQKKNSTFL